MAEVQASLELQPGNNGGIESQRGFKTGVTESFAAMYAADVVERLES